MKNLKGFVRLSVAFAAITFLLSVNIFAQSRDRIVKTISSQPTNAPTQSGPTAAPAPTRPTMTSPIIIRTDSRPTNAPKVDAAYEPAIKKTASSRAIGAPASIANGQTAYGASISARIYDGIMRRFGIPYRYGSTGPNTYDCSGFVWAVFNEAGVPFTRASARSLWAQSEPVYGDDRFKFGTLVFLNGLGHMGIVADENGFYHASSSKGITYSPFAGYWSSRIVGFRRLGPEVVNDNSREQ